jgi:hypothetical protein
MLFFFQCRATKRGDFGRLPLSAARAASLCVVLEVSRRKVGETMGKPWEEDALTWFNIDK